MISIDTRESSFTRNSSIVFESGAFLHFVITSFKRVALSQYLTDKCIVNNYGYQELNSRIRVLTIFAKIGQKQWVKVVSLTCENAS